MASTLSAKRTRVSSSTLVQQAKHKRQRSSQRRTGEDTLKNESDGGDTHSTSKSISASSPTSVDSSHSIDATHPTVNTKTKSKSTTTKSNKKYQTWAKHANASPYPKFQHPTHSECHRAYTVLSSLHGDKVQENFAVDEETSFLPEGQNYTRVLDALIVATLGQATSWANAKRAMSSMTEVYGSPFAYDAILSGGQEKLALALRPGGMHNRKSKMVMSTLTQVRDKYDGQDDWKDGLNHLFESSDQEAMEELMGFDGVGPKSAFCVLSICLRRKSFAVDTHIYRVTGLWGWRPQDATRELAQAHLDARIPGDLKYDLHYLFIAHGRECRSCRAGPRSVHRCEALRKIKNEGDEHDDEA